MGRGMSGGRGGGRGMGGGRGIGRGIRSAGSGQVGMGAGRGMGRGMASGMDAVPAGGAGGARFPSVPADGSEIDALKAEAQNLEAHLQAINARTAQLESGSTERRLVAMVDAEKCTRCGLCVKLCPVGAIMINTITTIDVAKCTGCGECVAECPQGALTLKKA